jgi:hypothetical protein
MTDCRTRRNVLLLICVFIAVGVLLLLPIRYTRQPQETREEEQAPPAPVHADSAGHHPVVPLPVTPDTLPVRIPARRAVPSPSPPRPLRPDTLRAELGVYEFIRDFYADVRERTLTVLLEGSRLDSAGSRLWMFMRGPANEESLSVRHFVVAVDSVRPLRTYIFPGWGYGSDWAPLPDGSIGLEGRIEPKAGTYRLSSTGGKDQLSWTIEKKNDRLSIHLWSLPGYSYLMRFGVEYAGRTG